MSKTIHAADDIVILKADDTMAVLPVSGNVTETGLKCLHGLYHNEMRHSGISRLTIDGATPQPVGHATDATGTVATFHLKHENFDITRTVFLANQRLEQRIDIRNNGDKAETVRVGYEADTDFENMFHIRGDKRAARKPGEAMFSAAKGGDVLRMHYSGIQGATPETTSPPLSTALQFASSIPGLAPEIRVDGVKGGAAVFEWRAEPKQSASFFVRTACNTEPPNSPRENFDADMKSAIAVREKRLDNFAKIDMAGPVGEFFGAAVRDLNFLVTETPQGLYPYAGTPVFNRGFGRDGIIAALEAEMLSPDIMFGALRFMAASQAKEFSDVRDAEPGKIPHELSKDEMSQIGRLPYKGYCGSADSTPLFLMLAGRAAGHIGTQAEAKKVFTPLMKNLELALEWIDVHSNPDSNGFARYARKTRDGLATQVWKDSENGIVHADGTNATRPIAAVEVQGYIYDGLKSLATVYGKLGQKKKAEKLVERAEAFRARIEENFWREKLGTYALAIDGNGKHCDVQSSNPGHLLWCGVPGPEHAGKAAAALMSPEMFSGWGIRTLGAKEKAYGPNTYHNGSVWPHDNALCAQGLARYGHKAEAAQILHAMYDAYVATKKIPELIRGDERVAGKGPQPYYEETQTHIPANDKQAWAAAAPPAILQSLLGLEFDAANNKLIVNNPYVPDFFPDKFSLKGLTLNGAKIDLEFEGKGYDVAVRARSSDKNVQVKVTNPCGEDQPCAPAASRARRAAPVLQKA